MPVAAARQAEVGAADPQPAIGGGVGKHLLEQLAVGLLDLVAFDQCAGRIGDPTGEGIADLLELTEVEDTRRTRGGDPVRHDDPTETLGDQPAELALEPPDLPPQLGPRKTLVDYEPVEYSWHTRILSALEGRCSNP